LLEGDDDATSFAAHVHEIIMLGNATRVAKSRRTLNP
jgi:hypothetical protein